MVKDRRTNSSVHRLSAEEQLPEAARSGWRRWLEHPERVPVRRALFQMHLVTGASVAIYVLFMSLTGSLLVFRDELSGWVSIRWLVDLHANLLGRDTGRAINGIGGVCLTFVSLTGLFIWW